MKRNHVKRTFALAASALAISTAVVGCRDYDVMDEVTAKTVSLSKGYADAFVQYFGTPDPNHDWGMNEDIGVIGGLASAETRAGKILINRNEWAMFGSMHEEKLPSYNGSNAPTIMVPNYNITALAHDIKIPGWPHLNGLYYAADGDKLDETYYEGKDITSGMRPAGDITPYEIQYVSAWFRTHKNPKSNVKLHLSDFFIQTVSCDYDQVEYLDIDSQPPYQTGWEKTGWNGRNIASIADAKAHKDKDGNAYVSSNLSEPIMYELDQLGFMDIDEKWTHVNNFNRNNTNFSPEDNMSNPYRQIQYVTSSGTENFRCKPSWCTKTDWIYSWVLVRLTWVETVKHSNSPYDKETRIPREGYYLAFDFHGEKDGQGGNQVVNQDGYYSNWIVKITPGHFSEKGNARRIFCEDLGGSFDFDFNDAVIDVAFDEEWNAEGHQYIPIISVQAAGGTMPIYVEHKKDKYELHKLLESDNYTQVNVDDSQFKSQPPAIYRGTALGAAKPGLITIYVTNTQDPANPVTYILNGQDRDDDNDERTPSLNRPDYYDKTKIAPRAFSAPTSVKWPKECRSINGVYEHFVDWVGNKDWTSSGTTGAKWYEIITDGANKLYTSRYVPEDENPTGNNASSTSDKWVSIVPDATGDAPTIAHAVKADSYMKLHAYTGLDPIWKQLDRLGDNDRVVFVVVLSSSVKYNVKEGTADIVPLQGILTPADIRIENEEYIMSYNGTDFTTADMERFITATYDPNNKDYEDENVYTLQFSFTKSQLKNSTTYMDYILLYLKVGNNEVGRGTTLGENNGVTVRKWYVHY